MANKFIPVLGMFIDNLHDLVLGIRINTGIVKQINNGTNQSFKIDCITSDYTGRVLIPRFEAKQLRVPKNDQSPTTNTSV